MNVKIETFQRTTGVSPVRASSEFRGLGHRAITVVPERPHGRDARGMGCGQRAIRTTASVLLPLALIVFAVSARGAEVPKTPANVMAEFTFLGTVDHKDPFNEVTLDAVFTDPAGAKKKVPAFWAGGKTWRVRYSSNVVGIHKFKTECSDATDNGLNGVDGSVEVEPYKGDNAFYMHGPLRVSKSERYFEHADGTPFFWLGDTWWMGLSSRLEWPAEFKTLAGDRTRKGFNVVQIVAGLYPDMPAFDQRGANEAGFPWEKDYSRIRPEYFDAADRRIIYLADQGIMPCVVGAWGYHIPWLGVEKMKQHQRYVYARWGALPMAWCVAGEMNLPFYLAPGFPAGGEKQTAQWEELMKYCKGINCFDRPMSAHPTGIPPMSIRGVLKDPTVLDFDMLQTPHGQMDVLGTTVNTVRFSYNSNPPLPTVNAEPSYEMLFDKTPPEVARAVFWVCFANGARGYTYGANGIWQLNRKDRPYGNSPWGGNYGKISWDEAMNLGGSTQVALAKKFLMNYPWQRFEPKPQWASWAPQPVSDVPLGEWIWFPEGEPALDAPVASRFFRRTIDIPPGATVKSAAAQLTADDMATLWVNGEELGSQGDWHTLRKFDGIASKLKPGKNIVAVKADNQASAVTKNPAGWIGGLIVELSDGKRIEVKSDSGWQTSQTAPQGWQALAFDDSKWVKSKRVAANGDAPWGKVSAGGNGGGSEFMIPYAMGIPHEVRVIYVPRPGPITLTELEAGLVYQASIFDPATGETKTAGEVKGDANGATTFAAPAASHDWVLVLQNLTIIKN